MAEQSDFWPLMMPKSDPDIELRKRWRYALMLIGVASTTATVRRGIEKWVKTPGAFDGDLVDLIYGDKSDYEYLDALDFLREKGLIE